LLATLGLLFVGVVGLFPLVTEGYLLNSGTFIFKVLGGISIPLGDTTYE
jgi:hypothetical protein